MAMARLMPPTSPTASVSRDQRSRSGYSTTQAPRWTFRDHEPRSAGEYQAQFSGVVETPVALTPYYTVTQATVLPDGDYTVTVDGREQDGKTESQQARLAIKGGDTTPPGFGDFSVFTPSFDDEAPGHPRRPHHLHAQSATASATASPSATG